MQDDIPGEFGLVFASAAMRQVVERLKAIASDCEHQTESPVVLLTGETGTGKEGVARALAMALNRGELTVVHLPPIPDNMISSELFGHAKRAFTDAVHRPGLFREAGRGPILLDEIGDASEAAQAALLRVIQYRKFRPVGADHESRFDGVILAATHHDLSHAVEQKRFRKDLYFRLKGNVIHVPPLRERPEDIVPLLRRYLRGHFASLTPEALEALHRYRWPGNVRELENFARNARPDCKAIDVGFLRQHLFEDARPEVSDLPEDDAAPHGLARVCLDHFTGLGPAERPALQESELRGFLRSGESVHTHGGRVGDALAAVRRFVRAHPDFATLGSHSPQHRFNSWQPHLLALIEDEFERLSTEHPEALLVLLAGTIGRGAKPDNNRAWRISRLLERTQGRPSTAIMPALDRSPVGRFDEVPSVAVTPESVDRLLASAENTGLFVVMQPGPPRNQFVNALRARIESRDQACLPLHNLSTRKGLELAVRDHLQVPDGESASLALRRFHRGGNWVIINGFRPPDDRLAEEWAAIDEFVREWVEDVRFIWFQTVSPRHRLLQGAARASVTDYGRRRVQAPVGSELSQIAEIPDCCRAVRAGKPDYRPKPCLEALEFAGIDATSKPVS